MASKDVQSPDVQTIGGSDVAKVDSKTLVVPDSDGLRRFLAAGGEVKIDDNPDQVSLDIISRILDSQSVDEVLGNQEATHARDVIDEPLTLLGLRFQESDFENGHGFYALLDMTNAGGEKLVVTCGSANVMAQAWKLNDLDALPCPVIITQSSKETRRGYRPMWMVAAPADF